MSNHSVQSHNRQWCDSKRRYSSWFWAICRSLPSMALDHMSLSTSNHNSECWNAEELHLPCQNVSAYPSLNIMQANEGQYGSLSIASGLVQYASGLVQYMEVLYTERAFCRSGKSCHHRVGSGRWPPHAVISGTGIVNKSYKVLSNGDAHWTDHCNQSFIMHASVRVWHALLTGTFDHSDLRLLIVSIYEYTMVVEEQNIEKRELLQVTQQQFMQLVQICGHSSSKDCRYQSNIQC